MRDTAHAVLCSLCGLECVQTPLHADVGGEQREFCCAGCMNVYSILSESGVLASGVDVRETELFRRSQELGLISSAAQRPQQLPPQVEDAAAEERLFHVSGLWCSACAWLIEHVLRQQQGVLSAEVYFVSDLLKIRYLPQQFPLTRVQESLERLGYRAEEYSPESGASDREKKDLLVRMGVAAFLWVNVMVSNLAVYLGAFDSMPPAVRRVLPLIVMLLALPVVTYAAKPILRLAWRGLLAGTLRMESLLALGILAAYGYSSMEALRGGHHIYFDIACAITTLVLVGKWIEQGAKQRAAQTIASLHRMLPKKARVLTTGRERFVSMDALKPGDWFTVKAGERIPADGIVVDGESQADESLISGESAPVTKRVEHQVVAGSMNLSGPLTIRATTVGRDSTIAQIVSVVERALNSRSEVERRVDRVARMFVPFVIAVAVIAAVAWSWNGVPVPAALLRAVTILVIACPCALGVSTPLALTAAVGAASRAGILVRDSRVLEAIRRIDTVVLDKTGTVTEGDFALLDTKAEHLPLLASLEALSEHPLGQAAVRRARDLHIDLAIASNVEVHRGLGIRGRVLEHEVVIGTRRMFVEVPSDLLIQSAAHGLEGRTVSFYSIDGVVSGLLVFGSRIREDAKPLVDGLRKRGIRTMLLSGDSESTTESVAKRIGVDEYRAAVAPAEKARIVTELQSAGRSVAMIGDGINDAPALAEARLGIAMGTGADLAMRAASMVLLSGQLTRVIHAFDLSAKTLAVIRQNLFWAFFYNTLGIGFAAAGMLNPIVAAGAMVISSLSVVGNSYRLSQYDKG